MSQTRAYVRHMDGGTARWMEAFVAAAWRAGDDPGMCQALARQLRIVGDALGLDGPQLLDERQQHPFVIGGELVAGEDQLLDRDVGGNIDGDVPEVA